MAAAGSEFDYYGSSAGGYSSSPGYRRFEPEIMKEETGGTGSREKPEPDSREREILARLVSLPKGSFPEELTILLSDGGIPVSRRVTASVLRGIPSRRTVKEPKILFQSYFDDQLSKATKRGDLKKIKKLVEDFPNMYRWSAYISCCIRRAIIDKNYEIFEFFLGRFVEISLLMDDPAPYAPTDMTPIAYGTILALDNLGLSSPHQEEYWNDVDLILSRPETFPGAHQLIKSWAENYYRYKEEKAFIEFIEFQKEQQNVDTYPVNIRDNEELGITTPLLNDVFSDGASLRSLYYFSFIIGNVEFCPMIKSFYSERDLNDIQYSIFNPNLNIFMRDKLFVPTIFEGSFSEEMIEYWIKDGREVPFRAFPNQGNSYFDDLINLLGCSSRSDEERENNSFSLYIPETYIKKITDRLIKVSDDMKFFFLRIAATSSTETIGDFPHSGMIGHAYSSRFPLWKNLGTFTRKYVFGMPLQKIQIFIAQDVRVIKSFLHPLSLIDFYGEIIEEEEVEGDIAGKLKGISNTAQAIYDSQMDSS